MTANEQSDLDPQDRPASASWLGTVVALATVMIALAALLLR